MAFYNHRGTCEQYIKEGKGAIKWTRLSCRSFAANAVRLQLHVLAYNLGNFMRTLAMPKTAEPWSLTSLREKLTKIRRQGRPPRSLRHLPNGRGRGAAADVCGNLIAHRPATIAARSAMTAAVSDETEYEGRGVPRMKQSHEFRTREASNPNDWGRTRLVAAEFHCGGPR